MPNIVEYTSKSGLNPSDKGINAAENAAVLYHRVGQQIEGDINQIADRAVRHFTNLEVSELYKTGTELKMNLQKRYEQESALPENRNDPTFGDRYMAEAKAYIEEWQKGAGTEHGKQLAATFGASLTNEIFNHVMSGQADMDAAHVDDNVTQTVNLLGAGLITDPSEANYRKSIGTAESTIQAATGMIPDVGMRERAANQYTANARSALTVERYKGVALAIKNQIAETGGETSPAAKQLDKDVKAQLGFQYLSPEQQTAVAQMKEQAVSQGQELFNSRHATAKAQLKEEGQQAYADIHSEITANTLAGKPASPELVAKAQQFSQSYGAILPGEVAAVDDFLIRAQTRATDNAVQPFNQNVRDNIQAGFSLPPGDPRRPTEASLLQAYSHGQITKQDFTGFTEILNKLDKPETDPHFGPAFAELKRWQTAMAKNIGNDYSPGGEVARNQFIHDSTANFMALGRASGDWERTISRMTDAKNPGSFINFIGTYDRIAKSRNPAALILRDLPTWNPDNTLTWPSGSGGGRKPLGTAPAAPAGPPAAPVIDQKAVDDILLGKQ